MHKARKQIEAAMPRIDVVIEVLDARLPASSSNPMLAELRGDTPCVRVLSKPDLADPETTKGWLAELARDEGVSAVALDCRSRRDARKLPAACRRLAPHRGTILKPLRVMVAGIPNVGKSTLINTLRGKRVAKVGDVPALTRGQQRVEVDEGFVISDTPGVLWPKLDDQEGAKRLAASGAIRDSAMDRETIALYVADWLRTHYPERFLERFKLSEIPESGLDALEAVGRKRGCVGKGAEVDWMKASDVLLRELRAGKIGRISYEVAPEPA